MGGDLGSKSWRERVAEAEARARWPWWRRVYALATWDAFPFTDDDLDAMSDTTTCMAAEAAERVGLDLVTGLELWQKGDWVFRWMLGGNLRKVARALDRMEDRALELKRGWLC